MVYACSLSNLVEGRTYYNFVYACSYETTHEVRGAHVAI